eukprot:gnl/TRDRNA2_/TRDRNA2_156975_c0_seq1.p1 gnl/TRDRNA2_/TRDRNA2_156975_c0~~gnl/TRDRNA2_/TRDRNA2_156975_c0_seq1.p1  ORF type:complete len:226 (-),score=4.65 gnl/TRDRNA2_/TRDRNA2_156975_c0_seq1:47-724(-)
MQYSTQRYLSAYETDTTRPWAYQARVLRLLHVLKRLNVEFVGLYVITSPRGGHLMETWQAMLHVRDRGFTRAVGVCNFGVQHLRGLQTDGLELPAVNQVEFHVWWQQHELVDFCEAHGIVLMAYSSLGRARLFGRKQLSNPAEHLHRTEADLCLRWCLQSGHAVVPKSFNPKHISEIFYSWMDPSRALSCEALSDLQTNPLWFTCMWRCIPSSRSALAYCRLERT